MDKLLLDAIDALVVAARDVVKADGDPDQDEGSMAGLCRTIPILEAALARYDEVSR